MFSLIFIELNIRYYVGVYELFFSTVGFVKLAVTVLSNSDPNITVEN